MYICILTHLLYDCGGESFYSSFKFWDYEKFTYEFFLENLENLPSWDRKLAPYTETEPGFIYLVGRGLL